MYKYFALILFLFTTNLLQSQDIEPFQQFNGRYDYVAIGNTLNPFENNLDQDFCELYTSASAVLNLSANQSIVAAYLYWAGSGEGDTTITLNAQEFEADITYIVNYESPTFGQMPYFSCYKDITHFVISQGNTNYLLEDLDINTMLLTNPAYCENRTNFAGWSLYVIFEDDSLPLNQISLFQGLEIINRNVQEKTIELTNLNVLDNIGAKIGFLAWEGDDALNFGESLSINDNVLSNPPLNLTDNAFNGTNTFTNSNTLYNTDLDVYSIQDNIAVGDTSATIKITTGALDDNGVLRADLIILNNIITVLNSQLPDATVVINQVLSNCDNRDIEVDFTIFNINSTYVLPINTPIAIYADNELIAQSLTNSAIEIGGNENQIVTITLPETTPDTFNLEIQVDNDGSGNGIIPETNETNNTALLEVVLNPIPPIINLPAQTACNLANSTAEFNLTNNTVHIDNPIYFESFEDLIANDNKILIPESYTNINNPQLIYIRNELDICYEIYQLQIEVENCPPIIPQAFSPNNDGYNDWFNIQGLYDIFLNHELKIFNRYGTLIFQGNNDLKWYGKANRGFNNKNKLLPVGTYYYILHLNHLNYKDITGWVYVNY